jgi:hypothetical protein
VVWINFGLAPFVSPPLDDQGRPARSQRAEAEMRRRDLSSPDERDAVALTFADLVAPRKLQAAD